MIQLQSFDTPTQKMLQKEKCEINKLKEDIRTLEKKISLVKKEEYDKGYQQGKSDTIEEVDKKIQRLQSENNENIQNIQSILSQSVLEQAKLHTQFLLDILHVFIPDLTDAVASQTLHTLIRDLLKSCDTRHINIMAHPDMIHFIEKKLDWDTQRLSLIETDSKEKNLISFEYIGGGATVDTTKIKDDITKTLQEYIRK